VGADAARLARAPGLFLERKRSALDAVAGRLRALSPDATLGRGYAIVRSSGNRVRSASALESGELVDVRVSKGRFSARVEEVET
jgi:exodeoxyribonuclease VII large subunit